ncbi:MAG TPA: hypothetical protein VIH16_08355 [Bellilinea sp.]
MCTTSLKLWLDRVTRFLPGCETAQYRLNIGKTVFDQDGRRTGA